MIIKKMELIYDMYYCVLNPGQICCVCYECKKYHTYMENSPKDLIIKLFDDKIQALEEDYNKAVKAGMPSSVLYDEIEELEGLKDDIMEKYFFDEGIDAALEIIDSRIDYYGCLIKSDKADVVEFEIIKELEILIDIIRKLKCYGEDIE